MKNTFTYITGLAFVLLLTACSNGSTEPSAAEKNMAEMMGITVEELRNQTPEEHMEAMKKINEKGDSHAGHNHPEGEHDDHEGHDHAEGEHFEGDGHNHAEGEHFEGDGHDHAEDEHNDHEGHDHAEGEHYEGDGHDHAEDEVGDMPPSRSRIDQQGN